MFPLAFFMFVCFVSLTGENRVNKPSITTTSTITPSVITTKEQRPTEKKNTVLQLKRSLNLSEEKGM